MTRVLLLPGLASDAALWRHQVPALTHAGHTVHVTDAHAREDTLSAMARLVLAEHAGPLVLVGTSMGGILALEVFRQAPQRVSALALLGSSARPDTPEMVKLRSAAVLEFEQGRMDAVLRANVPFAFHPSRQADAALVSDYFDMVHRAGAAQLVRQNRAIMARPDSRPLLRRLQCPVLVMCGEADALTPPECSREVALAVPQAELHVLPACGHLLTWEQPEAVNALLRDWLARQESGPAASTP
ncbi:MAG: alpha/beta fold hydrolase [Betaproteobacteria bacterium]|jgi:pimeloyl-ACP methyl ester carboxylesterase|nr:alpha/beta hydrolase [Rubrivivax sp.]